MRRSAIRSQIAPVRREVRAGRAASVSGYIATVLAEQERRESLRELLSRADQATSASIQPRTSNGQNAHSAAAPFGLNAGALIALERGDKRMIALLQQALTQGAPFSGARGVVGQAWRNGRVSVTFSAGLRARKVRSCCLLTAACPCLRRTLRCRERFRNVVNTSVVIVARERGGRRSHSYQRSWRYLRRLANRAAQIVAL